MEEYMEQFENDNELLYMYRIQSHAATYLIQKYEKFIDTIIYNDLQYLTNSHRDEIKQLALIKLDDIVNKYREDKNTSFHHFFHLSMDNLIRDYLRTIRREFNYLQELGHITNKCEVSDGDWWYYSKQGRNQTFDNILEKRFFEKDKMIKLIKQCSLLQKKILCLRLIGYNQKEIAQRLHKKESSISYQMKIIREKYDNLET